MLPKNTTNTAQYLSISSTSTFELELSWYTYAAAAARISWRWARVKSDSTAEKAKVNISSTPMHKALVRDPWFMSVVRLYSTYVGITRRSKIVAVMIAAASPSIRLRV